jgi:hypothetical protein
MYSRGRHQRLAGIIMTLVAVGAGTLGIGMLYHSRTTNRTDVLGSDLEEGGGVALTIIGGACLIPGVLNWTVGSSKMDKALEMGASGTTLAPTPRVAGLNLQWRF